jgi:hypothetical protein
MWGGQFCPQPAGPARMRVRSLERLPHAFREATNRDTTLTYGASGSVFHRVRKPAGKASLSP